MAIPVESQLQLKGGLVLPSGAGAGKVLQSDASGVASWQPGVTGTFRGFSAYRAGGQTTVAGWQRLTVDTEEYDTNGEHTTGASTKFQPTLAGYYRITAHVYVDTGSSGQGIIAAVYKNGSEYKRGVQLATPGANDLESHCSIDVFLNGTTDYVEPYFFCSTAGLSANGGSSIAFWQGSYIGSAAPQGWSDTSWQAASFGTNWSNFGSGWQNVEYRKDARGVVELRGLAFRSTSGFGYPTTILTLPSGYRPPANVNFPVFVTDGTNTGMARLDILTTGVVQISGAISGTITGAVGTQVSLSGLSFSVT